MSADIGVVRSSEGTLFGEAAYHRICHQTGSSEVGLFGLEGEETIGTVAVEDAPIAESVSAAVQPHWVSHHHLAHSANQVFGETVLLKSELSTVERQSVV